MEISGPSGDTFSGMNGAAPHIQGRGLPLLAAHLEALDPAHLTARERLERELGPELTRLLVSALSGAAGASRARVAA